MKTIRLNGTDFGSVEDVKFEGKSLDVDIAPDGDVNGFNVIFDSDIQSGR